MTVLEQARLWFKEGNSDKVYEIDLVEVAAGQHVVNFRYGRRGSALRDGTKTPVPVGIDKARAIYAALVAEKEKGGYRATDAPAPKAPSSPSTPSHLLRSLARGWRSEEPLHVVVRKVGDRGLREAEPLLLELLAAKAPHEGVDLDVWRHVLVLALVRCGSTTSVAPLTTLVNDGKVALHVREAARVALATITPPPEATLDVPATVRGLEESLATSARNVDVLGFYLRGGDGRRAVLALVHVLSDVRLLRTLTWTAEVRRDAELFAKVLRRLDALPATPTIRYFRRRGARYLRRLAAFESPDYARFATELVVTYRETDAVDPRGPYDAFAPYHALNTILFQQSERYAPSNNARTWHRTRSFRPEATTREEASPQLWDRAPEALWRIGTSPAATVVIRFATLALRAQHAFLAKVGDDELAESMASDHPLMRRLAFDVAKARAITMTLVRGALRSGLSEAEAWVATWAAAAPLDAELLSLLVTAKSDVVRAIVGTRAPFSPELARETVVRAIAILMGLTDDAHAAGVVAVLNGFDALTSLDVAVLRDLLAHALPSVATFGAELLVRRHAAVLDALLASPHARVRSIGARLVASTPPSELKDDPQLLARLCLSDNVELRTGTRGLVGEVARQFPETGRVLAGLLIDALLTKQGDGVPSHVVSLLRTELAACLPKRDPKNVLALIGALSPHAREAGGLLLPQLSPDDVGLDDIARLASHDIALVRKGAWALATAARDRYALTPIALARLCDAKWDDSRAFAFDFVRSMPTLSADAIIAICDSVRPDVQALGKHLVVERWDDAHALRYLARLSEHPSASIQLLVSGLLDRHARGHLAELLPYFRTVLSRPNQGGVAKERVLAFLRAEATSSVEAASLLAPLLDRQSATSAVTHRAPLIATMVDIATQHPTVPVPVTIVPPGGPRGV